MGKIKSPTRGSATVASVTASPIAMGFNAWFPPDDETIRRALREGLVVVDTNVLLSLYKYDAETTTKWFEILSSLGSRLFIPHQVLIEFWRNRDKLAAAPEETRKSAKQMRTHGNSLEREYRAWATANGVTLKAEQEKLLADLTDVTERIMAEIDKVLEAHELRFNALPAKDEVVMKLASLTQHRSQPAVLGAPPTPETVAEVTAEAADRFARNIPPGYMDDSDNEETTVGKKGSNKYGDYFVWRETLAQAKDFAERRAPGTAYVVLITGDRKKDWYREHATPQGAGPIYLPCTELVEEMQAVAGATYLQLLPSALLGHARHALNVEVSEAVISRTESLGAGEWLPDEFELKQKRAQLRARARIDRDGRRCRVLKNSLARIEDIPSITEGTRRQRQELLSSGVLVRSESNRLAYVFTTDYEFRTPSAGASVIRAGNTNGWTAWVNDMGDDLTTVLAARGNEDGVDDEAEDGDE